MEHNKILFNNNESTSFFNLCEDQLKNEIENLEHKEIISKSIDEWANYFFNKHSFELISIYEKKDKISKDCLVYDKNFIWGHLSSPTNKLIKGIKVIYKIYFTGNKILFELKPTHRLCSIFEVEEFEEQNDNHCGYFKIDLSFSINELKDKNEDYIDNYFQSEFKKYKTMIENINNDANRYNNKLKTLIADLLNNRKNEASAYFDIIKKFNLKMNEDAPNITPIELKPIIKKIAQKPITNSTIELEQTRYCISDEDYLNINKIIYMMGTSMENTSETFNKLLEEELRNVLLSVLNTHYDNANGETFHKCGKTDINIPFENKSSFIGECKIWKGEKYSLEDAIKQIISYLTWRDFKVSLIIFNKESGNFVKNIIPKIEEWIKNNKNIVSCTQYKQNWWKCEYKKNDDIIMLNILIFDFYSCEYKNLNQ